MMLKLEVLNSGQSTLQICRKEDDDNILFLSRLRVVGRLYVNCLWIALPLSFEKSRQLYKIRVRACAMSHIFQLWHTVCTCLVCLAIMQDISRQMIEIEYGIQSVEYRAISRLAGINH